MCVTAKMHDNEVINQKLFTLLFRVFTIIFYLNAVGLFLSLTGIRYKLLT